MEAPIANCMNCGKKVPIDKLRLCFEVLVCEDCQTVALAIFDRGRTELRQLLVLLQESIRLALVEGRLALPDGPVEKVSKRDILKTIVQMVEAKDGRHDDCTVQRPGGDRVPDTLPTSGVPGGGDGVATGG